MYVRRVVIWRSREEERQGDRVGPHSGPEGHAKELALHHDILGRGMYGHRAQYGGVGEVLCLCWDIGEEEVEQAENCVLSRKRKVQDEMPGENVGNGAADEAPSEHPGEVPGKDDGIESRFA